MAEHTTHASFPLLKLVDVHTHIGHYHILHGVSLTVPEGRLTMLLGRNGAGKTTTLRTIMGLWRASAGSVVFDNTPIEAQATPDIARSGIAYVPETMGIFAGLTVRENLLLATGPEGFDDRRLIVDEPTKGLAPAVIGHLIEAFQELKRQRTTILLVEQNFHMARSLGDEVAVMDDGRVVHTGRMEDLAADEALQAQLLGLALGAHQ